MYFKKEDSFYKILKTIEKLINSKKISITIESDNDIFKNLFFGKQIIELLEKKNIDYKFICKDDITKEYFNKL